MKFCCPPLLALALFLPLSTSQAAPAAPAKPAASAAPTTSVTPAAATVPPRSSAPVHTVVVYNVENLFDADGVALYADYAPTIYSRAQVLTKVKNIARVLAQYDGGKGPDLVLLNEIEIDQTPSATPPDYTALLKKYAATTIDAMLGAEFTPAIGDLPAEALLLKACADAGLTGYTVIVGGDPPGKPDDAHPNTVKNVIFTRLPVKAVRSHPTADARNILEVQLDVDGYPLFVFNNHWKAGANDPKTELIRVANAHTLHSRVDELLKLDPNADIILGGDFNSNYNQKGRYRTMPQTGLNDILGSQGNENAVRGPAKDFYNLWFELAPADRGSDTYAGVWGTLMNLIITRGLYDMKGVQYVDNSFAVGRFPGLNVAGDGTPLRWSSDGPSGSGFADHFPISAKFTTVADNNPAKFVPLTRAPASGTDDTAVNKVSANLAQYAITLAQIPPGANLRDGTWTGKLFRVEGESPPDRYVMVKFFGDTYEVYSATKAVVTALTAQRDTTGKVRCYGELALYKGRWEFVVKSIDWVK